MPGEKSDDILLLTSTKYIEQKEYWINKLSGDFAGTEIPTAGRRGPGTGKEKQRVELVFPDKLCAQLKHLSYGNPLTIYVILMAALKALIYRYTGTGDITIISPVYTPSTPGEIMNDYVYIKDEIHGDLSFKDVLLRVKDTLLKAYENQDFPTGKLVEFLVNNSLVRTDRLSDIACLLKNIHHQDRLENLNPGYVFSMQQEGDRLKGYLYYDPQRYDRFFSKQAASHYAALLDIVTRDVEVKISRVCFLSGEEKNRLLFDFNQNRADFTTDKAIHQLSREYAQKEPDRVAVTDAGDENQVTYAELNRETDILAAVLEKRGIKPDEPVGILLNRSILMMAAILAAWKAGGAYLPIDTGYPEERSQYMLADSGARLLMAGSAARDKVKGIEVEIIEISKELSSTTSTSTSTLTVNSRTGSAHLAYVIYTSGSTGKPKGAMVEQIGMSNHIQAKIKDLQVTPRSIIAQNASYTFDISVWQFFTALAVGGKTVIYPQAVVTDAAGFINRVRRHRVTILEVVPSYLSVILDLLKEDPDQPALHLEYLLVTGEEVKANLVKRWFDRYPHIKMVNAYGPTEASDDITHHIMEKDPGIERIPLGKPLWNLSIYIVDGDMNLCPRGIAGEICVSGVGVGRGYLNNPTLTFERFKRAVNGHSSFVISRPSNPSTTDQCLMTNDRSSKLFPITPLPHSPIYLTGDLGTWKPDGTIEFLGRKDYQVKIRGQRIELGEIESLINKHSDIKEAVVIDQEDERGDKYLCAYVIKKNNRTLDVPGIREYISRYLPAYMVPAHFVEQEAFPLTPNGKIDRKKLSGTALERETLIYISKAVLEEQKHLENKPTQPLPAEYLQPDMEPVVKELERQKQIIDDYSDRKGNKHYPLSYPQKMIYNTEKVYPGKSSESTATIKRYREELDKELLEKAINIIIDENEGVRARIVEIEHEMEIIPAQYVAPKKEFRMEYLDFSDDPDENRLREWLGKKTGQPFELIDSQLFYFAYIKFNQQETGYYMKFYHFLTDGRTLQLITKGIHNNYRQLQAAGRATAANPPSYLHYIRDEQAYLQSPQAGEHIEYWYQTILPEPAPWTLADKGGDAAEIAANTLKLLFSAELTAGMNEYCKQNNSTLYKLVVTTVSLCIAKITGLDDFIIGTVSHGRSRPLYKEMMGIFINPILLRINVDEEMDFHTFLNKEITVKMFRSLRHQRFPFDLLAAKIRESTGVDIRRLYDINIVDHPPMGVENVRIERIFQQHDPTPLTLNINASKNEITDRLELAWTYQVESFTGPRIEQIHRCMQNILEDVLSNPQKKLSRLELVTGKEKQYILYDLNKEEIEIPANKKIPKLFKRQSLYVLSKKGALLPVGIPGELYTGGELKDDYLSKAGFTRENLVESPFVPGEKVYKTGAAARWLPDGKPEITGKIDKQVLYKGKNLDISEIETALLRYNDITDAVVILRKDKNSLEKHLYAFVTSKYPLPEKEPREFLSRYLPANMMPSRIIQLEEMPLTTGKKIDIHLLETIDILEDKDYAPPRNDAEKKLVEIWAKVLGIQEKIGITHDFFKLGGDSMKAIKLISMAARENIHFKLTDLFQHSTIEEIVMNATFDKKTSTPDPGNQEEVSGEVLPLPLQDRAFALNSPYPEFWNATFRSPVEDDVDIEILGKSIDLLIRHHDALRINFIKQNTPTGEKGKNSTWKQINRQYREVNFRLETVTLKGHDMEEKEKQMRDEIYRVHSSLDLEKDLLIRAILFDFEKEGKILFVSIHHFICDLVSLDIFREDLEEVYLQYIQGREVKMNPKTTSFKEWSRKLHTQVKPVDIDLSYWQGLDLQRIEYPAYEEITRNHSSPQLTPYVWIFGKEDTKALQAAAVAKYNASLEETLLSALVTALHENSNFTNILVEGETHGREAIFADLDLTRTIGWFTNTAPLLLEYKGDIKSTVAHTKNVLRNLPYRGIYYNIARYILDMDVPHLDPQIAFNYLGVVSFQKELRHKTRSLYKVEQPAPGDKQESKTRQVEVSMEKIILPRHPANYFPYTLLLAPRIFQSEMYLVFTFNRSQAKPAIIKTIDTLPKTYVKILKRMIKE